MSCNGCRALRKGCGETCILRFCLQWIDSPDSQAHATVFVAKFFGRAGLMSFISNVLSVPSLLFEACGRTVNPVHGAMGLLGAGNWQVCQAAVETVLSGGKLRPMLDDVLNESLEEVTCSDMFNNKQISKRVVPLVADKDLSLSPCHEERLMKRRRAETLSEESGTCFEPGQNGNLEVVKPQRSTGIKLLTLFR